jgi:hypothetical protein
VEVVYFPEFQELGFTTIKDNCHMALCSANIQLSDQGVERQGDLPKILIGRNPVGQKWPSPNTVFLWFHTATNKSIFLSQARLTVYILPMN